jgi:hypothetical protein
VQGSYLHEVLHVKDVGEVEVEQLKEVCLTGRQWLACQDLEQVPKIVPTAMAESHSSTLTNIREH